jgi:hypothetical protein
MPSPTILTGRPKQFSGWRKDWGFRSNELPKGNEKMRILVALLVVLAVLYYWDVNYNNGTLSDGVVRMERSMFHSMGH